MFQCKDLAGSVLWDDDCGGYRKVAEGETGECSPCSAISFGETTAPKKNVSTALPLLRQQMRRGLEQARL